MTISERFFEKMKEYQDMRKKIVDNFENRKKTISSTIGSDYYNQELQSAQEKMMKELDNLRNEKGSALFDILDLMESRSNERRADIPTEEQTRLLQAATMIENGEVDEEYLDSVAYALKKSPVCLAVLEKYATSNGLNKDYRSLSDDKRMSIESTRNVIQSLKQSVDDFIKSDTEKEIADIIQRRAERYGDNGTVAPKRDLFDDNDKMYSIIAPWMNSEDVTSFCAAVDS